MKNGIIFTAVLVTLLSGACSNSSTNQSSDAAVVQIIDTTKLAKGAVFYQCEMHPEVTSDKPGTCPKCGMDLQQVEKK